MKRLIVLLLFGLLALTSCGERTMSLSGEVIARGVDDTGNLTSIVVQTETAGTIRLALTENTEIHTNGSLTTEDFLTCDTLYPWVSLVCDARTGTDDTYENEKIRCYEAEYLDLYNFQSTRDTPS